MIGPARAGYLLLHQGWFVVGGGTGGMEYSVLLIAALVSIALMRRGGAH